jgi:hypothetical protein
MNARLQHLERSALGEGSGEKLAVRR